MFYDRLFYSKISRGKINKYIHKYILENKVKFKEEKEELLKEWAGGLRDIMNLVKGKSK